MAITVTVNTSLAAVMFLPTSFGIAPFTFTLPSRLLKRAVVTMGVASSAEGEGGGAMRSA